MDEQIKTGIYFRKFDEDVSSRINLTELASFARNLPNVKVVKGGEEFDSVEGLQIIRQDTQSGSINRFLLVGMNPRTDHLLIRRELGRIGISPYLFELVSIEEQCAWAHGHLVEANMKAKDLIAMAVARLNNMKPLEEKRLEVRPECLVIGGGIAGMQAALDVADRGFKTYLVERESELGGRTAKLKMTFPTSSCGICCMEDCKDCALVPKPKQVGMYSNLEILTNSEVTSVGGGIGNFVVDVKNAQGETRTLNVGTVILATGSETYDPKLLPEYGYGLPNVITSVEFEEHDITLRGECPDLGKKPRRISYIQCVGSRMEKDGPKHCSIVCCTYAIGQAMAMKDRHPETDIYIHYIDLRGPSRGFEEFYLKAREKGIKFVRGRATKVEQTSEGTLLVHGEDSDLGTPIVVEADLVVLSVGQVPAKGTEDLSQWFHHRCEDDGFLMEHNPRYSSETTHCVFVAGCAQGPKGIRYSIADAKLAAGSATELMERGYVTVEDFEVIFDEEKCSGCGICINLCPYDAIEYIEDEEGKQRASLIEARCRGCGVCGAACPSRAFSYPVYHEDQILAQLYSITNGGRA